MVISLPSIQENSEEQDETSVKATSVCQKFNDCVISALNLLDIFVKVDFKPCIVVIMNLTLAGLKAEVVCHLKLEWKGQPHAVGFRESIDSYFILAQMFASEEYSLAFDRLVGVIVFYPLLTCLNL